MISNSAFQISLRLIHLSMTHQIGALRRVSRLIKARLLFGSDSSPMLLQCGKARIQWTLKAAQTLSLYLSTIFLKYVVIDRLLLRYTIAEHNITSVIFYIWRLRHPHAGYYTGFLVVRAEKSVSVTHCHGIDSQGQPAASQLAGQLRGTVQYFQAFVLNECEDN